MSKEIDPDVNKLILGWTGHMQPPKWDDKGAYDHCYHCKDSFKSGHQHNCRLCGHLYCSSCTAKYHVPQEFKQKNKPGPDRICYGCRDQCLGRRAQFFSGKGAAYTDPSRRANFSFSGSILRVHPPKWVESSDKCAKCCELTSSTHNCRTCGELYCSECTTKLQVPPSFEKKGKSGPSRVCHECRFKIVGGAIMDESPAPVVVAAPPAPAASSSSLGVPQQGHARKSSALITKPCAQANCSQAALAHSNYCKVHDAASSTAPPTGLPGAAGSSVVTSVGDLKLKEDEFALALKFKGESSVLAVVAVTNLTTLSAVNFKLLAAAPHLRKEQFFYMCRGKPIFPEHWEIFSATHFRADLCLHKGSVESYLQDMYGGSGGAKTVTPVINIKPQVSTVAVAVKPVAAPVAAAAPAPKVETVPKARALFEFAATDASQLSIKANDEIILLRADNDQWWFGELNGARGWFPASYAEKVVEATPAVAASPAAIAPLEIKINTADLVSQASSAASAPALTLTTMSSAVAKPLAGYNPPKPLYQTDSTSNIALSEFKAPSAVASAAKKKVGLSKGKTGKDSLAGQSKEFFG